MIAPDSKFSAMNHDSKNNYNNYKQNNREFRGYEINLKAKLKQRIKACRNDNDF